MNEHHRVVTPEEWLKARLELLAKEKEFTRLRDQLSQQRRELPWERVDKKYEFDGPNGKETLVELFDSRSQLIVYHFMFAPDWDAGCRGCSWWADNFERNVVHLNHRDITMVAISRAPLHKIEEFKKRMGWTFKWYSSGGCDFNYDYCVSVRPEQSAGEKINSPLYEEHKMLPRPATLFYNYSETETGLEELPGFSVFFKDGGGNIFHTYSCYQRGLDMLNAGYHLLDLVPKGRDEEGLPHSMAWLRHRDRYED